MVVTRAHIVHGGHLLGGLMLAISATVAAAIIPIAQSVLPSGSIRYSVAVEVNGYPVEAMLDTGSVGLRIMPGTLPAAALPVEPPTLSYHFATGVRVRGPVAPATVSIGHHRIDGTVYVQSIEQLDCLAVEPTCPAPAIRANDNRLFGEGFPGRGYKAVLGIGLRAAAVKNPLTVTTDGSWIIDLPLPGQDSSGALTLAPTPAERDGYRLFQLSSESIDTPVGRAVGWSDRIPGCLVNLKTTRRVCLPTVLDTGAPFILVRSRSAGDTSLRPSNTLVAMLFGDVPDSPPLEFRVDSQAGAHVIVTESNDQEGINAGTLPYRYFHVFYDSTKGLIGIRPRDR